eukprot:g9707.t1
MGSTITDGSGGSSDMETAPSLPMFLESCSSAAREPQAGNNACFHVFSGNEACDADSMCSAICMAFLKQSTAVAAAANADGGGEILYVPVMPIPRADLALRREVLVLFGLCGVEPSSVVFADELDLSAVQADGRLRLTLMDHNAVSGGLSALGDAVVEIVDHHKDLEQHPSVQGSARDIAFDATDGWALVGSCCTLVAERMLAQEQEQGSKLLSSDVARLLLGVILVDTQNLDTESKRASERDVAAAEQLSSRVSWKTSSPQGRSCATPDELFDALRNAKFDPAFWKELSATDCLRYDYKSFHPVGESGEGDRGGADGDGHQEPRPLKFGMSSVLCRLQTLAEKGGDRGSAEALAAFATARRVDSLAVVTVTLDEQENMKKELLIFTHTKRRCEQMRKHFEGPHGEFLKLEATAPLGTSFGGKVSRGDVEEETEAGDLESSASLRGIGVEPLLDSVSTFLPSPLDRPRPTGVLREASASPRGGGGGGGGGGKKRRRGEGAVAGGGAG